MNKPIPKLQLLVSPFEVDDLNQFTPQAQQLGVSEVSHETYARYLMDNGDAFTVRRPDGRIVCVLGLLDQWEGRALAWAIMAHDAGDRMLPLSRAIRAYLARSKHRRLEAYIDEGFQQGHRWAALLGFHNETPRPMQGFYPNGNAAYLYARVR